MQQLSMFGDPAPTAPSAPPRPLLPRQSQPAPRPAALPGHVHPDVERAIRNAYQAGRWCAAHATAACSGLDPEATLDALARQHPGIDEAVEPEYVLRAAGWRRAYVPADPGWLRAWELPDGAGLCVLPGALGALAADLIAASGEGVAFQRRGRVRP